MKKDGPARIFFDIETVPTQLPVLQEYMIGTVKAPANYKDPEKIAQYIEEAKDEVLDKCALNGATNHIICIGCAIDDHKPVSWSAHNVNQEAKLLREFYDYLESNLGFYEKNTFVGHNIIGFDLKVLRQRSMVLGVTPSKIVPWQAKPWEGDLLYDTMLQWDAKEYIKLEKLALAFGVPMKKTMSGGDVYAAWKNGLHEQIADYCEVDVELVRQVYKKMVV